MNLSRLMFSLRTPECHSANTHRCWARCGGYVICFRSSTFDRRIQKHLVGRAALLFALQDQLPRRGCNASFAVGSLEKDFGRLDAMIQDADRISIPGLDDGSHPLHTTVKLRHSRHSTHQFAHAAAKAVSYPLQARDLRIALPRLNTKNGVLRQPCRRSQGLLGESARRPALPNPAPNLAPAEIYLIIFQRYIIANRCSTVKPNFQSLWQRLARRLAPGRTGENGTAYNSSNLGPETATSGQYLQQSAPSRQMGVLYPDKTQAAVHVSDSASACSSTMNIAFPVYRVDRLRCGALPGKRFNPRSPRGERLCMTGK